MDSLKVSNCRPAVKGRFWSFRAIAKPLPDKRDSPLSKRLNRGNSESIRQQLAESIT
jgi:hypothetical protein